MRKPLRPASWNQRRVSARLTQCFKATKALDVLTNKALDVESKMEVEQHQKFAVLLTFDCRQCVEGLLSHDGLTDVMNLKAVGMQERLSELCTQLAEATKGYGGFAGGKVKKAVSWKDGLPDTSSLDELLAKAKTTIDSIEGEAAEVLCNSLAEDWADWGGSRLIVIDQVMWQFTGSSCCAQ